MGRFAVYLGQVIELRQQTALKKLMSNKPPSVPKLVYRPALSPLVTSALQVRRRVILPALSGLTTDLPTV